jgi:hypothetical protein
VPNDVGVFTTKQEKASQVIKGMELNQGKKKTPKKSP